MPMPRQTPRHFMSAQVPTSRFGPHPRVGARWDAARICLLATLLAGLATLCSSAPVVAQPPPTAAKAPGGTSSDSSSGGAALDREGQDRAAQGGETARPQEGKSQAEPVGGGAAESQGDADPTSDCGTLLAEEHLSRYRALGSLAALALALLAFLLLQVHWLRTRLRFGKGGGLPLAVVMGLLLLPLAWYALFGGMGRVPDQLQISCAPIGLEADWRPWYLFWLGIPYFIGVFTALYLLVTVIANAMRRRHSHH